MNQEIVKERVPSDSQRKLRRLGLIRSTPGKIEKEKNLLISQRYLYIVMLFLSKAPTFI